MIQQTINKPLQRPIVLFLFVRAFYHFIAECWVVPEAPNPAEYVAYGALLRGRLKNTFQRVVLAVATLVFIYFK